MPQCIGVFVFVPAAVVAAASLRGSMGPDCVREAQAVRAIGGKLEAGHVIASAGCDRGPNDQKMFVAGFDW
ncbi:hypothetical protein [Xanthomonas sp. GW]|uniref:hypothetical protein n=1 Tax=Xanthomonas sp. GW TaxID=2724121 RepID=UPI00163A87BE|nr:hypothetical protein [Xanthomonas sp. GW]